MRKARPMKGVAEVRCLANHICRLATGACIQDDHPDRPPCTYKNCRVMEIARQALLQVDLQKPN